MVSKHMDIPALEYRDKCDIKIDTVFEFFMDDVVPILERR